MVGSDFVWLDISRRFLLCFLIDQTHTNHPHVCSRAHVETTEIHKVRRVHSRVCTCVLCVCFVFCLSSCSVAADELCLPGGRSPYLSAIKYLLLLCVCVCPTEDTVWGLCGENTPHQSVLFASSCYQSVWRCTDAHLDLLKLQFQ